MKRGGQLATNPQTRRALRLSGILLPIVMLLYGLQVAPYNMALSYQGISIFVPIILVWLTVGVCNYAFPATSKPTALGWLAMHHLCAALYLITIAGFAMPFTALWSVLVVASYVYFGRQGAWVSGVVLAIVAVIDVILHHTSLVAIATNICVIIAVIALAVIAIILGRLHEDNHDELNLSRANELLQKDRISTIINTLANAVLTTDAYGVIELTNAATLELLDTNSGLVGQPVDKAVALIDEDKKPISLFKLMREAQHATTRTDLSILVAGEQLRLDITYSAIKKSTTSTGKNDNDGYVLLLRDITKEKSLDEERDEFISVISHELRTPITVAEGTLSNLEVMMSRSDMPQDKLQNATKTAHDQVIFLADMVNDLSTLSRAERGVAGDAEVIDTAKLASSLFAEYRSGAEAKGLAFNIDVDPHAGSVHTSRLYLHELLQNLITNAIKYTKEGHVTLIVQKSGEHDIMFAVEDSGVGISRSDQAKIFDKFYRAEDYRTRETSGTGLGLYVSNKLARKLGTTIGMKSRLNFGSTFSITLPRHS